MESFGDSTNISVALRVLSLVVADYDFDFRYLLNIGVIMTLQGHLIEAMLLFKKMHRHMPENY